MNTQGIEKIADSLGYLVLNEDGAVLSSGGDLENSEQVAEQLMTATRLALRLTSQDDQVHMRRLSLIWEHFMYMVTVSNHKVYVTKRRHVQQEPVVT